MNEISKVVKNSYDRIAVDYYTHRDLNKFNDLLHKFVSYLSPKAHVLDAGCGAGIPSAKFLVDKGIKVTGIDLSRIQVVEKGTVYISTLDTFSNPNIFGVQE